jgi:hypothetical protein
MGELGRMTKEEWDDLEPRLVAAERAAHARFMESAETRKMLSSTEKTPGYLLLQRLRELNDQSAIRLFRATEMYHHELTRANITAAFLRGKELGKGACCPDKS